MTSACPTAIVVRLLNSLQDVRARCKLQGLEFGIFDHLDRGGRPIGALYRDRLTLVEQYDRSGFYAYHLAEHHSTPLGMAPSPSVFLSAIAQRTQRLRFGPLVYLLPLYHPLRLAEEIAMLDHLSGGRLEVGIGRGRSPIELTLYGCDVPQAQAIFDETLAIVLTALSQEQVTFVGKHYAFRNVPVELRPVQAPHPPLWYGIGSPESARYCGEQGFHGVTLAKPAAAAEIARNFFDGAARGGRPERKLGIARFIVVGETDRAALALARRAYPVWHESFIELFRRYGQSPVQAWSDDFDVMLQRGLAFAGSPQTVAEAAGAQLDETRANYLVGQFVFGDMSLAESINSIELFAHGVMPVLAPARRDAAAPMKTA